MRRRRKTKKSFVWIIIVSFVLIIIVFVYNFNFTFLFEKSVHVEAKKYCGKDALVFYPDSENGYKRAKEVAKRGQGVFDYALIPYGDFYLVKYRDGSGYLVDKQFQDLRVDTLPISSFQKISEMLRYAMKKDEIDLAYSIDFLRATNSENFNLDNVEMNLNCLDLEIYFKDFDYTLRAPLSYFQSDLNIDLGIEENYVKRRYISSERKCVCFTFDDGPLISTSQQIVDKLVEYDSSATFFVLGSRLGEKQIDFCKESIARGMEYGSHSQSHVNLLKVTSEVAYSEIMTPYNDLFHSFGYQMKVFRPPFGNHNDTIDDLTNLVAVCWNVDSNDWSYRINNDHDECVRLICEHVINDTNENDVILFHDIYQTSVDAAIELVEYYIGQGYQIVNVSELMDVLEISGVSHFSGR